jgi:hypothetical protein
VTWFYAPSNGALVHEDAPNPQYYDLELGTLAGQWKVVNVAGDATTAQAAAAADKQFGPGTKTNGKTAQTSNTSDTSVAAAAGTQAVTNAASDVLGLPTFSNLRGLMIRVSKVVVGMLLIAIGTVKLFHVSDAVKDVAPIVAKGAAL